MSACIAISAVVFNLGPLLTVDNSYPQPLLWICDAHSNLSFQHCFSNQLCAIVEKLYIYTLHATRGLARYKHQEICILRLLGKLATYFAPLFSPSAVFLLRESCSILHFHFACLRSMIIVRKSFYLLLTWSLLHTHSFQSINPFSFNTFFQTILKL